MRRRVFRFFTSLALLAGAPCVLEALDLQEIKSRGVLRVLVSADEETAMFNFKPGGEPGFERELIEAFARLHRLKVEPVPIQRFEGILDDLNAGKGDLITGIIANEARRKVIDFTEEVLPARHLAVSLKPHRVVQTLEQLREEQVGVIKGSSWASAAHEAGVPETRTEGFIDRIALFEALENGKITAMVMSVSDFTLALRRHPKFEAGVFVGPAGSAAWGVRKSDTALRKAVDEYLEGARKGGTWSRLIVKYLGQDALSVLKAAGQR